ncbi:MAG: class I SAM-dependent methyltransferase [Alphaproteobacteria bacterium]|nr:class I SAM-dependent methyltransferase [Alphaproteobacteria bacterium]
MQRAPGLSPEVEEALAEVRDDLLDRPFTDRAVAQALGHIAWSGPDLDGTWWRRRNLAEGELGQLVDVFVRGEARSERAMRKLLPDAWWRAGLVETVEGGARATGTLLPLGDDFIWTDRADRAFRGDDGIFLPDSTTYALRRGLPPEPPTRHLDLGCGSGAVAVVSAPREHMAGTHCVCVDLNPRAPAFAQRTALLSGKRLDDVRVGSAVDADALADVGPFEVVTFVLPLLVPWKGIEGGPVHTVARESSLLVDLFGALRRLLADGGLAILYCQDWVGGGPLEPALRQAFGERGLRGGFWWDCQADHAWHDNGRPLRAGVLALRADAEGPWVTLANDAPDLGVEDWWPWIRVLLGE